MLIAWALRSIEAGIPPWPKLFQNLRSSRETELAEHFPIHVVCSWIGNSQLVAMRHYLQITDEHFHRGAGRESRTGGGAAPLRTTLPARAADTR